MYAIHNNVFKPLKNGKTYIYDPTAHGERQLISWYYKNKLPLKLPEAEELTIVTTLDPCIMCAGALLTAGFNVGVIAMDQHAGVNYDNTYNFCAIPGKLNSIIKKKFGYYSCGEANTPEKYKREKYVGADRVAFCNSTVTGKNLMGCKEIFSASADVVHKWYSLNILDETNQKDPWELPDSSAIKRKFREIYPDAFTIRNEQGRLPGHKINALLKEVIKNRLGKPTKNAVALLDQFGNVILCLTDTYEESPIQTAFMNISQSYFRIVFELMDNEETREEAEQYLRAPQYGTFVFLYAPNPNDSTTIMDLGAYGSTIGRALPLLFPANFQYFNPPLEGTITELYTTIMKLPPTYKYIGITCNQVVL